MPAGRGLGCGAGRRDRGELRRTAQPGPVADGPADPVGPADHLADGDGAAAGITEMVPGVAGVVAVVTHHPQPSLRDFDVERYPGGLVTGMEIGLVDRVTVDQDPPLLVAAGDPVAADA